MKRLLAYAGAVILAVGFWAWVILATAVGLLRKLVQIGQMIKEVSNG